jgi:hypothetical protein
MTAAELRETRVIDLVRVEPAVILELADLGISPRYLEWTLQDASRDLGINLDRVVSRVRLMFDAPRARAS